MIWLCSVGFRDLRGEAGIVVDQLDVGIQGVAAGVVLTLARVKRVDFCNTLWGLAGNEYVVLLAHAAYMREILASFRHFTEVFDHFGIGLAWFAFYYGHVGKYCRKAGNSKDCALRF